MTTPHADGAAAQETTLANRYGRDHRHGSPGSPRRIGRVVAALALAAAVALAAWTGLAHTVGRVQSKDVGFEILDDAHARVTFQVTVPAGRQAECDVVVKDSGAAVVGFRTVRPDALPAEDRAVPSDATQTYTADVRTVGRGVTGLVEACRAL